MDLSVREVNEIGDRRPKTLRLRVGIHRLNTITDEYGTHIGFYMIDARLVRDQGTSFDLGSTKTMSVVNDGLIQIGAMYN